MTFEFVHPCAILAQESENTSDIEGVDSSSFPAHGYVPRSTTWGNGRDCVQSLVKTEVEAMVLTQQIAGLTHTIEVCATRRRASTPLQDRSSSLMSA